MSTVVYRGRPWMITAALGLAYVLLAPASADLAAASYRSDLFARAGFTLWDNGWYGGHHLPAYSVLAPALGALLGPRALAAVSATIAAALFSALIDARFPRRATRIAAAWFAAGVGIELLSGRVAFNLGLALGLAALLATQRHRRVDAFVLALLCALASPVAGAFLALATLAWALAARGQPGLPGPPVLLALAGTALLPILLLALAFPEGGSEPFVSSSFLPAFAGVLVLAALTPARARELRAGALLYALALALAYLLPTPVGGNAVRLGALVAGPLAVCALTSRRTTSRRMRSRRADASADEDTQLAASHMTRAHALKLALALLLPLLLYWQLVAPVRDFALAAGDPAVQASYYAPLLEHLRAIERSSTRNEHAPLRVERALLRIEIPPTRNHWEARWVAAHVALARGWERQLDRAYNPLFYASRAPTAASYRAWLLDNAVAYVALADAALDTAAHAEAKLIARGAPYLREVWHSEHWRLFAVLGAHPLVSSPATLTSLNADSFTLQAPHPGQFDVRVRFSRYWAIQLGSGCVHRAPGGWTQVDAYAPGALRVGVGFSLARVFAHGPRCRT
ncbi:MAG TPA: hypothetical protein VLJ42_08440 [Solirubrobacteraceae bacterium]|nr:hypothetical protein [Solirubrobacteraceae bacterium]